MVSSDARVTTAEGASTPRQQRRERILRGDLRTTIPYLALPLLLSGQLLQGMALLSTFWMGRLAGTSGLAIAATVTPFEQAMTLLFLAIALGNSVHVARTVGAGGEDGAQLVVTSTVFAGLLALGLGTLGALTSSTLVRAVTSDPALAPGIRGYLVAVFIGLPATGLTHVIINSVSATGFTQFGTVRLLVELVVTGGLTPVAMIMGLGVLGPPVTAALTAAVLNVLSALAIGRLRPHLGLGNLPAFREPIRPRYWLRLVAIGLPVQAVRLSQVVALGVYLRIVMHAGPHSTAGFGLAFRFFFVMSNIAYCLSRANAIVVGQNFGAGERDRVVKALKWTTIYTLLLCVLFALLVPALRPVMRWFSSDPHVVDEAMVALTRLRVAMIGVCLWQALLETYMALGTSGRSALLLALCSGAGIAVAHFSGGDAITRVTRAMGADQLLKSACVLILLPWSFFGALRRRKPPEPAPAGRV